ncbi:malate synthase G [Actibacterium pelagium]|uniref:Malate synthase G n=1 Tax=Actibacterium pelagium TaxID=2029103 RepID=A0A917AIL7_9RHOB|nr:malate synthase G [Actibacterium pelagium]GGE56015.1 malate synthase G [Actibacterium pelagium]
MALLTKSGLSVADDLHEFVETEMLEGTGVSAEAFWDGLAKLVAEFAPRNKALLAKREDIQSAISNWHKDPSNGADPAAYEEFLREIGYIEPEGGDFKISPEGVDPEVAQICGPQLVVPISNARFALNAANARWGSLYDSLYGTDAISGTPKAGGFDAERGAKVIAWVRAFLDEAVPLAGASHADVSSYTVEDGQFVATVNGVSTPLATPAAFAGYTGAPDAPQSLVLQNNGLHIIIEINPDHTIGQMDKAGVSDVKMEAALTAIMDCEDSVAAVDGEDKTLVYRNWLGLMRGDLSVSFKKGSQTVDRKLEDDLQFTTPDGGSAILKGRALMFVRNVGHLMTTPAVLDPEGNEIPEGIMDAMFTVAIAMHDLNGARLNSPAGSVYIVKPKMHGSAEVTFTNELFGAVEDILGLPRNTVKMGVMDEERRTSVNLKECIRAAKHRIIFVNTGFLDRTGDEIHTSMEAGLMVPKADMKSAKWLSTYEDRNVDIALSCGFAGKAQIGKGMWAMPDLMADMLEAKIGHPMSGANCAWVPSPTAAVLHATHYHKVDVAARQAELAAGGPRGSLSDLLTYPVQRGRNLTDEDIQQELRNNAQGILGYVVRWVNQGVGCSKVPDINDVGQMEDRATCRISAQLLANWLHHGLVSEDDILAALHEMAQVVDRQNEGDPGYIPMGDGEGSFAFAAARDLVLQGATQPSGYTEPLLHSYRLKLKAAAT